MHVVKQKVCSCQNYFLLGVLSDRFFFVSLLDLWVVIDYQLQSSRCSANFLLLFSLFEDRKYLWIQFLLM